MVNASCALAHGGVAWTGYPLKPGTQKPVKEKTRRVVMANTLGFLFGIVAPVAGVSWLLFLH